MVSNIKQMVIQVLGLDRTSVALVDKLENPVEIVKQGR